MSYSEGLKLLPYAFRLPIGRVCNVAIKAVYFLNPTSWRSGMKRALCTAWFKRHCCKLLVILSCVDCVWDVEFRWALTCFCNAAHVGVAKIISHKIA